MIMSLHPFIKNLKAKKANHVQMHIKAIRKKKFLRIYLCLSIVKIIFKHRIMKSNSNYTFTNEKKILRSYL